MEHQSEWWSSLVHWVYRTPWYLNGNIHFFPGCGPDIVKQSSEKLKSFMAEIIWSTNVQTFWPINGHWGVSSVSRHLDFTSNRVYYSWKLQTLPVLHSSTSLRAVVAAPSFTATMKHEGVYMLVTVVPYLQHIQHFAPFTWYYFQIHFKKLKAGIKLVLSFAFGLWVG